MHLLYESIRFCHLQVNCDVNVLKSLKEKQMKVKRTCYFMYLYFCVFFYVCSLSKVVLTATIQSVPFALKVKFQVIRNLLDEFQ